MRRLSGLLLAALLLAACQTTRHEGDESSPYYVVPAGSTLTLHRELTIPAEQVGIFLQHGEVKPATQINWYRPHCKFELRDLADSARRVQPDTFVITRATQEILHSVRAPVRVAARIGVGIGITIGGVDDGSPSHQTYATRMDLKSERQPQVFRLTCGHWEEPARATHLSIREMRSTLGQVFTLTIPALGR